MPSFIFIEAVVLVTTLIPAATGTVINLFMNGRGGAAAGFDGTSNQSRNAGAGSGNTPGDSPASSSGYNNAVGKQWSAPKTVTRFKIYGPNDNNVLTGTTTTTKLQGSNDGVGWTDLYTSGSWGGSSSATLDVTSGITVTTGYTYHRVNSNGDGTNSLFYTEVEFYEDI